MTDPPLGHKVVVLFVKIDGRDLFLGVAVEKTTLFGEINNLEWLESACKLTSRYIRIDIQNLPVCSFSHRSQDR